MIRAWKASIPADTEWDLAQTRNEIADLEL
jgi:hypothetical protein